jgi:hypothetical protein
MIQPGTQRKISLRTGSRWDDSVVGLTRPIGARSASKVSNECLSTLGTAVNHSPDHDADHHDETAGRLDQHHGYAERTDELEAIGVRDLRGILEGRENSGRETEEGCPDAKLRSHSARRVGGQRQQQHEGDESTECAVDRIRMSGH